MPGCRSERITAGWGTSGAGRETWKVRKSRYTKIVCRFFMCAEHGTNQSLNGKRKPILAPKISFKKNNEEVANVYLTQTAGRKRLTFSGKSFILNLAENK